MFSFFYRLVKQKKLAFFVLLFFVLAGIILPAISHAAAWEYAIPLWGQYAATRDVLSLFKDKPAVNIGVFLMEVLSDVIYAIEKFLGTTFAKLFTVVLSELVSDKWAISRNTSTHPSVFLVGWDTTKNLANTLIVVALIGIAVATILRFREYEAKKLLLPLVVVALLVNFSGLFFGLVVDSANIIMQTFVGNGGVSAEGPSNIITVDLVNSRDATIRSIGKPDVDNIVKYAVTNLSFGATILVCGTVLFYLAIILVVRYIILGILFIFAPLAFVCRVFPVEAAKRIWSSWWQRFIRWTFIGVGMAFFIRLSVDMVSIMFPPNVQAQEISPERLWFNLSMINGILLIGVLITLKSAVGIAKAVIGLTTAAIAGIATGGLSLAGKLAGGVGKALGSTKAGEKVKQGANWLGDNTKYYLGRGLEGAGLKKTGQANIDYQNKITSRVKQYEQFAEGEKNNDVVADRAMNSNNAAERAAYTQVLHKRNKLHLIKGTAYRRQTRDLRQAAVDNAQKYGFDTSEYAKSDYRYAEFDNKTLERLMPRIERSNPTFTPAQVLAEARRIARQEQLEASLSSMSGEQLRNIDKEDITPELIASRAVNPNTIRRFKTADDEHIGALNGPGPDAVRLRNHLRRERLSAIAAGNKAEANRLRSIIKEIYKLPH